MKTGFKYNIQVFFGLNQETFLFYQKKAKLVPDFSYEVFTPKKIQIKERNEYERKKKWMKCV